MPATRLVMPFSAYCEFLYFLSKNRETSYIEKLPSKVQQTLSGKLTSALQYPIYPNETIKEASQAYAWETSFL